MRLLLLVALSALTAGCASTAPEAPAPAAAAQAQTPAANDLSIYTGTYALAAKLKLTMYTAAASIASAVFFIAPRGRTYRL